MKFERHYDISGRYVTHYTSENGYKIKSNASKDIFTSRMIQADYWYIYNSEGERIDGASTLKEAKAIVERIA